MDPGDYVIDQKRKMVWSNPYEAMLWYRGELDKKDQAEDDAKERIIQQVIDLTPSDVERIKKAWMDAFMGGPSTLVPRVGGCSTIPQDDPN